MTRTLNATEARIRFGQLLRRVAEDGDTVIVERNGQPSAVVLSYDDYEKLRERQSAAEILKKTGFVGCAEGPGTLSSTYKDDLAVLLAEKHDRR